jgi:hypothetical protein
VTAGQVAALVPALADVPRALAGAPVVPVSTDAKDWTSVRSGDARLPLSRVEGTESVGEGPDGAPTWLVARGVEVDPLPQPPVSVIKARDMPSDSAPDVAEAAFPGAPVDGTVAFVEVAPRFWPDGEAGGG